MPISGFVVSSFKLVATSVAYLILIASISLFIFMLIKELSLLSYFVYYSLLLFFIFVIFSSYLFYKFPFFVSIFHRVAQDCALLLAGLIALVSLLDYQSEFNGKIKSVVADQHLGQVMAMSTLRVSARDECRPTFTTEFCRFYAAAIRIASIGTTSEEWSALLKDVMSHISSKYEMNSNFNSDKSSWIREIEQKDLTKNQLDFLKTLILLSQDYRADLEAFMSPTENLLSLKNSLDNPEAKLFATCFFVVSFALLFARNLFKEDGSAIAIRPSGDPSHTTVAPSDYVQGSASPSEQTPTQHPSPSAG